MVVATCLYLYETITLTKRLQGHENNKNDNSINIVGRYVKKWAPSGKAFNSTKAFFVKSVYNKLIGCSFTKSLL